MAAPLLGRVHGNTVVLDQPVPPLDGKRVRVGLEAVEELALTGADSEMWRQWVESGPQGPIDDDDDDDDDEPEFP